MTNINFALLEMAQAPVLFNSWVLSGETHTNTHSRAVERLICLGPSLCCSPLRSSNSAQFQLNFMLFLSTWPVFLRRVAVGKGNQGRDDREGSQVKAVCRVLQWLCVCVSACARACDYTPQLPPPSPSSSVPLHSIVFWASDKDKRQCFKNEQQPGAQTGWKRERWREYCNHLVPLFSVWLDPPLWGFENCSQNAADLNPGIKEMP